MSMFFWCCLILIFTEFLLICFADDSPKCGWVKNVEFTIIDEELIDFTNPETTYTANVTFKTIKRKFQHPDYYIALIGHAFELNKDFGCIFGMKDVFARSTNCLEMDSDGHCLETSGNSMLVTNLKLDHSYGIILCAIVNPTNRQLPSIDYDDKTHVPPFRVDRIYAPLQRNAIKMISREGFIIFSIAAFIDFLILLAVIFCCRFWHLRHTLKRGPVQTQTAV